MGQCLGSDHQRWSSNRVALMKSICQQLHAVSRSDCLVLLSCHLHERYYTFITKAVQEELSDLSKCAELTFTAHINESKKRASICDISGKNTSSLKISSNIKKSDRRCNFYDIPPTPLDSEVEENTETLPGKVGRHPHTNRTFRITYVTKNVPSAAK